RLREARALEMRVTMLFLLAYVLGAAWHRGAGVGIIAAGSTQRVIGAAHDNLRNAHVIESSCEWASSGILAFLFAHGLVLGNRLFAVWNKNTVLAAQLAGLNRELESRVESRTLRLAQESKKLWRAKRFAEGDARKKSRFLATLSHELRTPLA